MNLSFHLFEEAGKSPPHVNGYAFVVLCVNGNSMAWPLENSAAPKLPLSFLIGTAGTYSVERRLDWWNLIRHFICLYEGRKGIKMLTQFKRAENPLQGKPHFIRGAKGESIFKFMGTKIKKVEYKDGRCTLLSISEM